MKRFLLSYILILSMVPAINAQDSISDFKSALFDHNLKIAGWLVESEFINEIAIDFLRQKQEPQPSITFSYQTNNIWHATIADLNGEIFSLRRNYKIDSLYNIEDSSEKYDTAKLEASLFALLKSENLFQVVRDTSSIYFSSFLYYNTDQTISVWFLPVLQPSGQALYGCEWEYIFDLPGKKLLRINSVTNPVKGVWLGQPREFRLFYPDQEVPTVGSLYFALSFRDFFTRVKIDTRSYISTIVKNSEGVYTWSHRKK